VTTVTDAESRFLESVPTEISEVLDWYRDRQPRTAASQVMSDFAGKFLGAMYQDGAVVPETLSASAPEILALLLLQHRGSPQSAGAWLNLGFALRRMALYRTQDSEHLNRLRLQTALQAFDRSLELDPDNNGKNIRAWTGKSFTYHLLLLYEEELQCCSQALEADRSDPQLWLLYGFALKSAGKEEEAVSMMNGAYDAYVLAGKPEGLREVFADVESASSRPCRQRMA
jgi:tetratricopeptide (TPR) repeat protein